MIKRKRWNNTNDYNIYMKGINLLYIFFIIKYILRANQDKLEISNLTQEELKDFSNYLRDSD